jgi:hypothetical protein
MRPNFFCGTSVRILWGVVADVLEKAASALTAESGCAELQNLDVRILYDRQYLRQLQVQVEKATN